MSTNKSTIVLSVVAAAAVTLIVQFLATRSEAQIPVHLATHSYKVVRLQESFTADQLQVFLNENAKDGWNLKQVVAEVAIYER